MTKGKPIPRYIAGQTPILAKDLNEMKRGHDRFGNMRAGQGVDIFDGGSGPVIRSVLPKEADINFGPWFTEVDPGDASKIILGRQRGFDDYPFEDEVRMHLADGDRVVVGSGSESLAGATTGTYFYLEIEKTGDDVFTVDFKKDTDKPDEGHADRDADIWWIILGQVISASGGLITEYRRWRVGNWRIDFCEGGATCTSVAPNEGINATRLVAWYFGGGIPLSTDQFFTPWPDSSGNGNTMSQPTANARPFFIDEVASANNQPGVKFRTAVPTRFMFAASKIFDGFMRTPNDGFEVHIVAVDMPVETAARTILSETGGLGEGIRIDGPAKDGSLGISYEDGAATPIANFQFAHSGTLPTGIDKGIFSAGFTNRLGSGIIGVNELSCFGTAHGDILFAGNSQDTAGNFTASFEETVLGSVRKSGSFSPWFGTLMSLAIFKIDHPAGQVIDRLGLNCWAHDLYGIDVHGFTPA